ncbi:MAG: hypothetical protein E6G89_03315 [Alphaproteobacteria bacterium]|nr:MAG: hypothetical protein E6G89_03315 [Alphaproteobacteria bacterium]
MSNFFQRLIPRRWRKQTPLVHVVRLHGTIGIGTPFKPPLTMEGLAGTLERAFARKGIAAVALIINSPGGAAVQSALIHARIRALSAEKNIPVFAFCEDVERLKSLQRDVHEDFKRLVRSRRDGKLRGEDSELFSGAFWSGRQALALGLIDGIGHMRDILRARFGDRTEFKLIARPQGWGLRRLGFGTAMDPASGLIDAMEIRALWGRFGL